MVENHFCKSLNHGHADIPTNLRNWRNRSYPNQLLSIKECPTILQSFTLVPKIFLDFGEHESRSGEINKPRVHRFTDISQLSEKNQEKRKTKENPALGPGYQSFTDFKSNAYLVYARLRDRETIVKSNLPRFWLVKKNSCWPNLERTLSYWANEVKSFDIEPMTSTNDVKMT